MTWKKNQLVEMEMTKMMELTEKDFKQTVYSPYSQKCRGKICMTRTEIEDIKNKKNPNRISRDENTTFIMKNNTS